MSFTYKKCGLEDLELLVKTRVEVLRAANKLDDKTDMSLVERESEKYYEKALTDGSHGAYLVFDENKFIGAGGISYYSVMPTYHNPSGEKAYIMNMYTVPEYRRRGIAYNMLDLLVNEAKARGVKLIGLEATDAGRPLYEKYGFTGALAEMELLQP